MNNNFQRQKTLHSKDIYKLINKIRDIKRRNLIRGYISKPQITFSDADIMRRESSPQDSLIIGELLKGPLGLLSEKNTKKRKTCADLFRMTLLTPVDWKNEVWYTIGYMNSMKNIASEILDEMRNFVFLEKLDSYKALELLLDFSKKHGASNYLSYKLAFLRSTRELCPLSLSLVSEIEDEIEHRETPGMHFSALENISSNISLFMVAQRRTSGFSGKVNGDYRKYLSLSNFIPTPLDKNDVSGFLLRSTESCLVDTVYAVLVIFSLVDELGEVTREFEKLLSPELVSKIVGIMKLSSETEDGIIVTDYYRNQCQDGYFSLELYRLSSALIERSRLAKFRNKLDRVISVRLLGEIIGKEAGKLSCSFNNKNIILAENNSAIDEDLPISLDTFYRTFLFLLFISNNNNLLDVTKDEIKFIFNNTVGLDALLTEKEIRKLYLTSPVQTKGLVTVLALALFREKSIDPDVDFQFRTDFISHIKSEHNGSIIDFINYLLSDSLQIANYIVRTLDEVTLEKMYTLVKNASEASQIRCEILRAVGQKLNRIEYIIEADSITTRAKLSKLQKYFDSSRMYVDSVAMKKWLDSNPTISTEQYRALYPRVEARRSSLREGGEKNLLVIQVNDKDEYLVSQIVKDAFEQFCLNAEFGIQSYLGRRIRHNTLDGVTTDTVDAVFRKREYSSVMSNSNMLRTVETWISAYKSIIDKLRKDQLQFKSNNSLFNATLDLDDQITKENIKSLANSLKSAGGTELLNDLVIAFCWKQITPQLENAARHIKTTLLKEANSSIDKYFSGCHSAIEDQLKLELHEAVNEVFRKVADWFQVPQTGFISASVTDLCQIIMHEMNRNNHIEFTGNALNIKYTGISVHRMYDCLAVLLNNAQKHGEKCSAILVDVCAIRAKSGSLLDYVSIDITSTVSEEYYMMSKERILQAIKLEETSKDMVTEGYTGIKKIKFITRASENQHTIRCVANDESRQLKLGFSIHAETTVEDFYTGALQNEDSTC